ncbi:uncharacterized protein C2845_PM13G18800 [Panicum miliaceum]|uniref:Protein FAR1-RELATED SEQUENCE n=1 Tax=Panicum miliaceum TaxID=4540 RepID=A0A3L6RKH8_PANMI|nr:uncharacterized protein C2845_PM13G18800 [Panicum miliaceum]
MTSTQRSESQNRVLKDGYVSESTSLHMFAKRMLDSLQHADHMDTGLFPMHNIRALTHLQVRKSINAREEVAWDRHDGVRIGAQASEKQTWMSKLFPKLMKHGRAGSRLDRAFEETDRQLDKITPGIEMFPRSADVTTEGASSALHNEMLLIEPPASRTKGRSPRKQKKNGVEPPLVGNPLSTYTRQNYGDRECSTCGVWGTHYSTTCPINIDRSKATEKHATKRGANTQDGTPRKRGRPKIIRDLHEANGLNQDDVVATQVSSSATGGGARGGTAIGSRRTRAARVNYQE